MYVRLYKNYIIYIYICIELSLLFIFYFKKIRQIAYKIIFFIHFEIGEKNEADVNGGVIFSESNKNFSLL